MSFCNDLLVLCKFLIQAVDLHVSLDSNNGHKDNTGNTKADNDPLYDLEHFVDEKILRYQVQFSL